MPQAKAAQAAERAQTTKEAADAGRVVAAAAGARAEAELLERQRAHDQQVDDLSQQLQQLRYARRCSVSWPPDKRFSMLQPWRMHSVPRQPSAR